MVDRIEVRFGDICDESAFGPRFSGENYASDGNVATLRTTDMRADGRIEYQGMPLAQLDLGPLKNHILRRGDLCITRTGRVGTTAVFEEFDLPVVPGAFLIRFRLSAAIADPFYYQYYFNSPEGQHRLLATATGSVQQNLNITALHEVQVPLPSIEEQQRIAGMLGALDDKIEQNRRTAGCLERLARAIFRAWFVDFEPVRAKAAGETSFPGMPQEVFDSLPDRLVDSELGAIPEGWGVEGLGEIAEEIRRAAQPSEVDPSTPYIGLEHMPRRSTTLDAWEPVAKVTSNKSRFDAGQILFGKLRPYFHKVGIAPLDGVCSTDIVVIDALSEPLRTFTLGVVSSDEFVAFSNAGSTGTKMPRTKWADMRRYPVTLAPADVIEAYHNNVAPMLAQSTAGVFESRKLAELRDYLLPKLLSGAVRVKGAGVEEGA